MTNQPTPDSYIVVNPMTGAQFVIKVRFIKELNEAWEEKPAMVFIQDPDLPPTMKADNQAAIPVTADEYNRLKHLLTGEPTLSFVPKEENGEDE
jgi:hypothetical protein